MTMGNRTHKSPFKYRVGYYEVDLISFKIRKVSYTFKDIDKCSRQRLLKRWLGD